MLALDGTSRLLKILGDATRLRILHLLDEEELTGTDLVEILNMAQSRIATHLSVLRRRALVTQRRVGRRTRVASILGPAGETEETVFLRMN